MKNMAETKKWYGVKFLLPYLKPFKVRIIITFFSMLIVAVTTALAAYAMKPILNNLFVEKDEAMLVILPAAIVVLFVTRGIFRFFSIYLASSIGIAITKEIRSTMYDTCLNAEYPLLQKRSLADFNTYIIQIVLRIRNTIAKTIPNYIISVMTIIALVAMILYLNWKLALLAIVFVPIILVPMKYLAKKVKIHVSNAENTLSTLINRINESFNNIDLVKVYNKTEHEQKLFDDSLDDYQVFQLKLSKYQEATSPLMEFFVSLSIASVVYFGGREVIDESMTVGDFFAFLTALMMLYAPIKIVTKNALMLSMLDVHIERIEKVLSYTQEKNNLSVLIDPIQTIEFKNVSFRIGKKQILKKLNFKISANETIALVGKTGAGKSSILGLIFGFHKPNSGQILINGIDISMMSITSIRDSISYVNQSAGIFNASIQDNILYGLEYNREKYIDAVTLSHCEFIEELPGTNDYSVGENGKKLSGGQRQRIALARALYKDGSLFVLDEATSALDTDTENMIQESLQHIMNSKTTIVIAHRLNTILNADKVYVVSEGEIVEAGTYASVSKSAAFKNNFGLE